MWFRNLLVYRLTQDIDFDTDKLQACLLYTSDAADE